MKILVVGIGVQGSVIATELVRSPEVSEVRLVDIDLKKAEWLAERLKSEKVSTQGVDANKPDDLLRAAKGMDVVVNASVPIFNLKIMKAALKSGACYQDLALGSPPSFEEALSSELGLSDQFKDAGLTALINTGTSPRITNVVAKYAADRLDQVDEIRMRWFGSMESKEYVSLWSPETMWLDMELKPIVYENGKLKKVPPFSGEEKYKFPDPVGLQTVVHHHHEDVLTLSQFIKGVKYVDFKAGGPHNVVAKAIIQLGMLNDKPITVKGVKVAPVDVLISLTPPTLTIDEIEQKIKADIIVDEREYFVEEVSGHREGKEVQFIFNWRSSLHEAQRRIPGATALSYITGVPASIFSRMLGKGEIQTLGVIPPECLESEVIERFLAELAEKGIIIHERVERRLA
jgi:saccharopine dehydrogenase (NAD+, L-lysine-forming)